MNVSGTTIVECDDGSSGDTCAEQFPFNLTYEGWDEETAAALPKVTEWAQAPDNYNDPSWANPYDVSKGHRGFIDGDFVMMMYATAPNWKAGTVGNEAYNLYIRRSFDGGQTWTTLPASFAHIDGITYNGDGTETCEDYGWGGQVEEETCTTYGAGDFEQARNVSRLTGSKVTVLDPRYSPTGGMLKKDYTNLLCDDDLDGVWENCGYTESSPIPRISATRPSSSPPSRPAITPWWMSRPAPTRWTCTTAGPPTLATTGMRRMSATMESKTPGIQSTSAVCDEGETDLRWDWLENGDDWAVEASVYGNPNGDRFYAVWNQELPVDVEHEIFTNMDTEFRRIFYNLTDTDVYPRQRSSTPAPARSASPTGTCSPWSAAGRDYDHIGEGIVAYRWMLEPGRRAGHEQTLSMPAAQLTGHAHHRLHRPGQRGQLVSGKQSTNLLVAESYQSLLPACGLR